MRRQKKRWLKPEVGTIELGQARDLISSATRLIEDDPELEQERAELQSIIQAIDSLRRDDGGTCAGSAGGDDCGS